MVVRITRLMEYEYATVEQALASMESWAVGANAVHRFGSNNRPVIIRSAVIGPVYGEAAEAIHTAVPVVEDNPEDGSSEVDDLVRRARDLVNAVDAAISSESTRHPGLTLYRDRLRHWLQSYAPTKGEDEPSVTEIRGPIVNAPGTATVVLFKDSGKYYTQEPWRIPEGAMGPYDMERSPDFHRISNGPVLVPSQEPWGYPFLLVAP